MFLFVRNRPPIEKYADNSIILHIYIPDVVNYLKIMTKEQLGHNAIKRTGNSDL